MRTLRDFGFGKQKSMESVMDEEITLVLERMDSYAGSGEELSMRQFFTVSILNILWSMVAGFRFPHDNVRLHRLINLIDETSKNNPAKASIGQAFPLLRRFLKNSPKLKQRQVFVKELQDFFKVKQ